MAKDEGEKTEPVTALSALKGISEAGEKSGLVAQILDITGVSHLVRRRNMEALRHDLASVGLNPESAEASLIVAEKVLGLTAGSIELLAANFKKGHDRQLEIADMAIDTLPDPNAVHGVDPEFLEELFEIGKTASNEDLRLILARILASEALEPGRFSKRVLRELSLYDRMDGDVLKKIAAAAIPQLGIVLSPQGFLTGGEIDHAQTLNLIYAPSSGYQEFSRPATPFRWDFPEGGYVAVTSLREESEDGEATCSFRMPARLTRLGAQLTAIVNAPLANSISEELVGSIVGSEGSVAIDTNLGTDSFRSQVHRTNETRRFLLLFQAAMKDPDPRLDRIREEAASPHEVAWEDSGIRKWYEERGAPMDIYDAWLFQRFRDRFECGPYVSWDRFRKEPVIDWSDSHIKSWFVDQGLSEQIYEANRP